MKKQKIISYGLLVLILLPLLFTSGLHVFQQYVKYTVEHRLESEVLVNISVPLSQVEWMEEGREIKVGGRMFDIKTWSEEAGMLTATGVYDDDETAVVKLLAHFGEKEQNGFLVRLLVLAQTFVALLIFFTSSPFSLLLLRHFSVYKRPVFTTFLPPPFQPPRVAFSCKQSYNY